VLAISITMDYMMNITLLKISEQVIFYLRQSTGYVFVSKTSNKINQQYLYTMKARKKGFLMKFNLFENSIILTVYP